MQTGIISSKYQICIPKKIREELHIKAGEQFIFIVQGNTLQLVPKRDLESMRGIMAGANKEDVRDRQDRR
jgi:AbrB family looped-hinge helix DNA binding protein